MLWMQLDEERSNTFYPNYKTIVKVRHKYRLDKDTEVIAICKFKERMHTYRWYRIYILEKMANLIKSNVQQFFVDYTTFIIYMQCSILKKLALQSCVIRLSNVSVLLSQNVSIFMEKNKLSVAFANIEVFK